MAFYVISLTEYAYTITVLRDNKKHSNLNAQFNTFHARCILAFLEREETLRIFLHSVVPVFQNYVRTRNCTKAIGCFLLFFLSLKQVLNCNMYTKYIALLSCSYYFAQVRWFLAQKFQIHNTSGHIQEVEKIPSCSFRSANAMLMPPVKHTSLHQPATRFKL